MKTKIFIGLLGLITSHSPAQSLQQDPCLKPKITVSHKGFGSSSQNGNQWYKNGQPIPGATGSTYSPTGEEGTYSVKVRNECGDAYSEPVILKELEHRGSRISFSIFPNPFAFQGVISYSLPPSTQKASCNIYDLQGRIVLSFELPPVGHNAVGFSAESIKRGEYLCNIVIDDVSFPKKRVQL
jgi:hypothetical protein